MGGMRGWKCALMHRGDAVCEEGLELPGASWEAVAEPIPVRMHVDEAG